jgi:hypothetical protein
MNSAEEGAVESSGNVIDVPDSTSNSHDQDNRESSPVPSQVDGNAVPVSVPVSNPFALLVNQGGQVYNDDV